MILSTIINSINSNMKYYHDIVLYVIPVPKIEQYFANAICIQHWYRRYCYSITDGAACLFQTANTVNLRDWHTTAQLRIIV